LHGIVHSGVDFETLNRLEFRSKTDSVETRGNENGKVKILK
jgi:hypothetical protein